MPLVDVPDTELARKEHENSSITSLYDLPRDGKTPLDGAGEPMKSVIQVRDVAAKLKQGFTREPVGANGPALGETPPEPEAVPQKSARQGFTENAARAHATKKGITST